AEQINLSSPTSWWHWTKRRSLLVTPDHFYREGLPGLLVVLLILNHRCQPAIGKPPNRVNGMSGH
ncbi:hypothetical protein NOG12_12820, partial [Pseudidiomarina sp. GXY010]